jgi:hypothetical protein
MGGIYSLIASVPLLQALVTMPFFPEETEGNTVVIVVAWLLPFLLLVLTGVVLIARRDQLARWIFADVEAKTPTLVEIDDIQDLAFAVLGIYLVVSTLPNLGSVASALINLRGSETFHEYLGVFRDNLMFYLGTITKLIVGAYLFMYAHSIGGWWRKRKNSRANDRSPSLGPVRSACPDCGHRFSPADYRSDADVRLCSNCQKPLPEEFFGTPA